MMSTTRIGAVMFKEFRQLSRDKLTFAMIVMIPLIQLTLFGFAINTDVRMIPVAVVDNTNNATGRAVLDTLKATQVVDIVTYLPDAETARQAIQNGEVKAVLVLPHDINNRIETGRVLGQWMVDGTDSVIGGAITALQSMPFTLTPKLANQQQTLATSQTFDITLYYNPSRRTAINIVPGLLGIILSMTMILFTSIAIVRERERGNLELLITTPVSSLELMIAKIVPYIFVGMLQVAIVLGLGALMFNVPINGSPIDIALGSLLFISASLTLGLLISTIAQSQLQAMQMTLFVLLPSILLSGFMFPYEGMPVVVQWISEALPATHFMRMIRGLVLRSAELSDLWKDTLWLIGFTLLGVLVSAKRFAKSLD
ncbi:ABC transporter permease [Aestuariibacter sp. GS-14]|uniref:ABC transporter permease n=1 Tax=Aestuariibacter sp. GS-14 TaxID=2590670 RepID=UPI00112DD0C4|nr:ABC transporter permease [Aestuariibacter sp. GS-14]TPV57901.1 ABC transporter permease [Aestuariibacter sp. GS-14]